MRANCVTTLFPSFFVEQRTSSLRTHPASPRKNSSIGRAVHWKRRKSLKEHIKKSIIFEDSAEWTPSTALPTSLKSSPVPWGGFTSGPVAPAPAQRTTERIPIICWGFQSDLETRLIAFDTKDWTKRSCDAQICRSRRTMNKFGCVSDGPDPH